jgi:hypothetical protein
MTRTKICLILLLAEGLLIATILAGETDDTPGESISPQGGEDLSQAACHRVTAKVKSLCSDVGPHDTICTNARSALTAKCPQGQSLQSDSRRLLGSGYRRRFTATVSSVLASGCNTMTGMASAAKCNTVRSCETPGSFPCSQGSKCPDGRIGDEGFWIRMEGGKTTCQDWKHAAKKGPAAVDCYLYGSTSSDKFVCSRTTVAHVHYTPQNQGVIIGKRIFCEKKTGVTECQTYKTAVCVEAPNYKFSSMYNDVIVDEKTQVREWLDDVLSIGIANAKQCTLGNTQTWSAGYDRRIKNFILMA